MSYSTSLLSDVFEDIDTFQTVQPPHENSNAFSILMGPNKLAPAPVVRDIYNRPTPQYNTNYNPEATPRADLLGSYSPYVFGEPLFDDRPAIQARFPRNHTLAASSKRLRTA